MLVTLVIALLFAYYIAVGVIMSYMNISMLPKIFALTLPSFFTGVAVTLLVLDIRYGTHIRRHRKTRKAVKMMLVMIDDVQFESKEKFFKYISRALGCEDGEINSAGRLFDVLCEFEDDIEVTFYDKDDILPEMKNFSEEIFAAFLDAKNTNDKLTVSFEKTTV